MENKMYKINTQLKGESARYPQDFPLLQDGRDFAMIKVGSDYIIQTTISDMKKLKRMIKKTELKMAL